MTELVFGIVSIIITALCISIVKIVDYTKFKHLVGSYKATTVIIIIIVIAEGVYLSVSFQFLTSALETVTSLGAVLIFLAFVFLNKLQNAASGLSMALGSRGKLGDQVEIDGIRGTIVQLGLTKTVLEVKGMEGMRYYIPNKVFDEKASFLTFRKKNRISSDKLDY